MKLMSLNLNIKRSNILAHRFRGAQAAPIMRFHDIGWARQSPTFYGIKVNFTKPYDKNSLEINTMSSARVTEL